MTALNILSRRGLWSTCWTAAPKASHTKQLGNAARKKRPASDAACTMGLPAAAVSMMLLGPGVTAATTAKRRNARTCSVVVRYLHESEDLDPAPRDQIRRRGS